MDKRPSDLLYEAANEEMKTIVDSELGEYGDNKVEASIGKAYKITVCYELLSLFEFDDFSDETAQKILDLGKSSPLEFLYEEWISNSTISNLGNCLMEMISEITRSNEGEENLLF